MTLKPAHPAARPACRVARSTPVVVDDPHLDARQRAARPVLGDDLGRVVVAAHADGPRRLGEPVAGDDVLEPELLAHPADEPTGNDGRAGDREPQRGQVERSQVGVVEDGLEDRRRSRQHRDPFVGHPPHHGGDVEHRVRDGCWRPSGPTPGSPP